MQPACEVEAPSPDPDIIDQLAAGLHGLPSLEAIAEEANMSVSDVADHIFASTSNIERIVKVHMARVFHRAAMMEQVKMNAMLDLASLSRDATPREAHEDRALERQRKTCNDLLRARCDPIDLFRAPPRTMRPRPQPGARKGNGSGHGKDSDLRKDASPRSDPGIGDEPCPGGDSCLGDDSCPANAPHVEGGSSPSSSSASSSPRRTTKPPPTDRQRPTSPEPAAPSAPLKEQDSAKLRTTDDPRDPSSSAPATPRDSTTPSSEAAHPATPCAQASRAQASRKAALFVSPSCASVVLSPATTSSVAPSAPLKEQNSAKIRLSSPSSASSEPSPGLRSGSSSPPSPSARSRASNEQSDGFIASTGKRLDTGTRTECNNAVAGTIPGNDRESGECADAGACTGTGTATGMNAVADTDTASEPRLRAHTHPP